MGVFTRGLVRAFMGELRAGLDDLAVGTAALAALPGGARADWAGGEYWRRPGHS